MALPKHTTVTVAATWTCLNTGDSTTGKCTIIPEKEGVMLKVTNASTVPSDDVGQFPLPTGREGGAWKNETILEFCPGATGLTYIHAKADGPGASIPVFVSLA